MILVFPFITSLILTYLAIPSVLRFSNKAELFDLPGQRKVHKTSTPTLGGVGIFGAFALSASFWVDSSQMPELQYIICSLLLMFFTGVKDDIFNIRAHKKLVIELIAAFILVNHAGIRLTSMYGLFGVYTIPEPISYLLSIITIIGITNAFNLIDGIDLLATISGIIASLSFGIWFTLFDYFQWAVFCFALAGSLIGFSFYNKTPAKIFMGDTGALIVGITCSILAIKFVELNREHAHVLSAPTLAIAILITPIFDTIRVFFIRILNGKSPIHPDRNHLHHMLIDNGLTHHQATLVLGALNLFTAALAFYFQDFEKYFGPTGMGAEILLATIFIFYSILFYILGQKAKLKAIHLSDTHENV